MKKIRTSVCIVGGGPAGSTASLFLSKHKIHHVLLEKDTFPRHKVCGEAYDGRVLHNLNRLNPSFINEMFENGIIDKTWRYTLNTNKSNFSIEFDSDKSPKLLTYRYKFDQFLIEKAKKSPFAQVFENQTVKNKKDSKNSIIITSNQFEVEADFGIMAKGNYATFNKKKSVDKSTYLFTRSYFTELKSKGKKEIEIYFLKKHFKGILYITPAGPELNNIIVGIKKSDYLKQDLQLEQLFKLALTEYPEIHSRVIKAKQQGSVKGAFLNFKSSKLNYRAGERLLNIGAASYSINPITGAGVGNSMTMARIAADSIKEHLEDPKMNTLIFDTYNRRASKALKPFFRANKIFSLLTNNPSISSYLVNIASNSLILKKIMKNHGILVKIGNPLFYLSEIVKSIFHAKTNSYHPSK